MKKLLTILLLAVGFSASAQFIPHSTQAYLEWYNTGADTHLWIPSDTLLPSTGITGKTHIARKGTSLYYWNGTLWVAVGGGGGTPTVVITRVPFGGASDLMTDNANFNINIVDYSFRFGGGSTTPGELIAIGQNAGLSATAADHGVFLSQGAGDNATNANSMIALGWDAGSNATNAAYSSFIGEDCGFHAAGATNSFFAPHNAGLNAIYSSYSNFLGFNVGRAFSGDTVGSNNHFMGTNISLPNGYTNRLNIGGVLFGSGLYSTTTGNPSVTAVSGGKIGIGIVDPVYTCDVLTSSNGTYVANFYNSGTLGFGIAARVNHSNSSRAVIEALGGTGGGTSLFSVRGNGDVYAPLLSSSAAAKVLHYNPATGLVSYADTSSLSGLPYWALTGTSTLAGTTTIDVNGNPLTIGDGGVSVKWPGSNVVSIGDNAINNNGQLLTVYGGGDSVIIDNVNHNSLLKNYGTTWATHGGFKVDTFQIDLSIGDYTIVYPGIYIIINAATNNIIFSDPSLWIGHEIIIYNIDNTNNAGVTTNLPETPLGTTFVTFKPGYSYSFHSGSNTNGPRWVCTAIFDGIVP